MVEQLDEQPFNFKFGHLSGELELSRDSRGMLGIVGIELPRKIELIDPPLVSR